MEDLIALLNDVMSDDPYMQLHALRIFRKLLHIGLDFPCQKGTEAKFLNRLIYFLYEEELPQHQHEALIIISSLAEYSKHITVLVDNGVVPGLVGLISSPTEITRAMAITTLLNIAKESAQLCEVVIRHHVELEVLLLEFSTPSDLQDASRIIRLFCNRKPQLKSDTVKQVLVVLEQNLNSSKEDILVDTCWTLASLCEDDKSRMQVVINSVVCCKLIELLGHKSPLVVEPALETVANIATAPQMEIEHLLDDGLLPRLLRILLSKYDNNMKKNACKSIGSIARTHTNHQIQGVVGYGVVFVLADMFEISDIDFKMEVARTISVITSNGTDEVLRCVGEKCIKPLCDMLDCWDSALIPKCLGGLERILKAWETEKANLLFKKIKAVNGLTKIKNLRYDDNIVVSERAKEILEMFWPLVWDYGLNSAV